jgi:hypothetical protein
MKHDNRGLGRILTGWLATAGLVTGLVGLALAPAVAQAQTTPRKDLKLFKNFFVTGDYVAAGVSLENRGINGVAKGDIVVGADQIPPDAEIVAAYLYWQSIAPTGAPQNANTGAKFRGNPIASNAVLVNRVGSSTCSSNGGATGDANGSRAVYVHRADVLRYFPRLREKITSSGTGTADAYRFVVNATGAHSVELPDGLDSNKLPSALGASLVIVYRQAGYLPGTYTQARQPLRSIVIYEGGHTMNNARPDFEVQLDGFYQALSAAPNAKLTAVVSNGQANFSEKLSIRSVGATGATTSTYTPPLNPFRGTAGVPAGQTDAGFDVVTFTDLPRAGSVPAQTVFAGDSRTAVLRVEPAASGSFDCLSFSTVVASTPVQDRDADGLLDVWETSETLVDANDGTPLPNLKAMGADPDVQDVFVQIDYMYRGNDRSQQNLLPSRQALAWVTDAFKRAPITARGCAKPNGSFCPIRVHFDVGADVDDVVPGTGDDWVNTGRYSAAKAATCASNWTLDCAILPAEHSRGGNAISAPVCDDQPANPLTGRGAKLCAFPGPKYAGTVGWKSGLRAFRDGKRDSTAGAKPAPCVPGSADCRFPRARKDMFRYVLFAHALALPSSLPQNQLAETYYDVNGNPIRPFTPPRKTSGIADVGGGDLMVTLGQWDGGKGSPFVQASTLMHEMGHLFGLRHGGLRDSVVTQTIGTRTFQVVTLDPQPNCKPNYQSVMNYLFQIRGVGDNGTAAVDYSRQELGALNEAGLNEAAGMGTPLAYDARWYAPKANSTLDRRLDTAPMTRRCDGTPFANGDIQSGTKDANGNEITPRVDYVRIDADPRAPDAPINWNLTGTSTEVLTGAAALDINGDGKIGYIPPGANDFLTMDLRQTGARRSVGSQRLSQVIVVPGVNGAPARTYDPVNGPIGGGLSLDTTGYVDATGYGDLGYGDLGYGDLGYGDLGYGDLGYGDLGYGDLGYGDLGYGDLGATFNVAGAGYGDLGYGDLGYGDLGYGDLGYGDLGATPDRDSWVVTAGFGDGSVDLETAADLGTSPRNLQATVVRRAIELRWDPPAVGTATYRLFRVEGTAVTDANYATAIELPIPATSPTGPVVDTNNLRNNRTYTYWVAADVVTRVGEETKTVKTRSNTVTITF